MATTTYLQAMRNVEAARLAAEKIRAQEIKGVIEKLRGTIRLYSLTAEDLFGSATPSGTTIAAAPAPVPVKAASTTKATIPGKKAKQKSGVALYSDDAGNSWSGRGPRPAWLKAKMGTSTDLSSFLSSKSVMQPVEAAKPPSELAQKPRAPAQKAVPPSKKVAVNPAKRDATKAVKAPTFKSAGKDSAVPAAAPADAAAPVETGNSEALANP